MKNCHCCTRRLGASVIEGKFCSAPCVFKYRLMLSLKPDAQHTLS
ncbi:hypothetical protein PS914_03221 [Pseudomonas fluorescens]|nr:hypothetical protein PS914_03221 [Pseudomonas fluorescens]